jgi:multidrug transporter EmrE-like cation transporter
VGYYESTFVFPVFNVSIVGITALAGVVFFREKLSAINWLGFALAALAIIVIAIG